jgi:FAD:protein FMN transferase
MPKMSTKPIRLGGAAMGTEWSVLIDGPVPPDALQTALQNAVAEVDAQMSTWAKTSDLMQFNAAPVGVWQDLPAHLLRVLAAGVAMSAATDGAFEMNVGDAVRAWGFCSDQPDLAAIRAASAAPRIRAMDALQLDQTTSRAKKTAPLALDLSGIAKGYGVDRLAEVLAQFGISQALCAIDGEIRAMGRQADGTPWPVALEQPDTAERRTHSVIALEDGAVATSGDYRHFLKIKGKRLSHTIDPRRGAPLVEAPASVSVIAKSCMQADAMATALTVMGRAAGLVYAREKRIDALFLMRGPDGFEPYGTGLFAA